MNRQIKFRAWDGQKMIYDGDIVIPSHLKIYSTDLFSDCKVFHDQVQLWFYETRIEYDRKPFRPENYYKDKYFDHITYYQVESTMQFTGLKDKNGVEIYEGDIVSVPYVTPMGTLTGVGDEEKKTHIVFEFGEFALKYPHHTESLKSFCKRTQGEYISNYGNKTIFETQTILTVIGNIHQ